MAACRFLKRKKAHYNLKYSWVRPFAQVICHPEQVSKNTQTVITLLLMCFLKAFISITYGFSKITELKIQHFFLPGTLA